MCEMKMDTDFNTLRLSAFGCFTHLLHWVIFQNIESKRLLAELPELAGPEQDMGQIHRSSSQKQLIFLNFLAATFVWTTLRGSTSEYNIPTEDKCAFLQTIKHEIQ